MILPFLALFVTGVRVWESVPISIATHLRVDEILAGATVALIHSSARWGGVRRLVGRAHPMVLVVVLAVCCHPMSGFLAYLRPYVAAIMVAGTLWREGSAGGVLASRTLKYFADVSYALYVIHPICWYGWLGSGGTFERYLLKRPVGFALTFFLAHVSTFYYEKHWIERGKKWSAGRKRHGTKDSVIAAVAAQPQVSLVPRDEGAPG